MKTRNDSFFGIHCDFHADPSKCDTIGATLREADIRKICRTLKPDFIQIDCKGHPGWASYPSEIGNAMPNFVGDPLALWRKVTREEDVALYLHYSGVYEIKYCNENPDECVMNADGSLTSSIRTDGKYVNELLIPQLSEIIEKYGVDGFWIDGECWSAKTDFRPETLAAFEKEYGVDLGGRLPATPNEPYYEEYREYHRELFRKYLRHYVDILHEKYPNVQIASNWAFSDHMPEEVSANVDFLSGDLSHNNSFNSARYAARALAQQGYPWDLMSWNFRIFVGDRSAWVSKHPNQILQEAASVISLGGAFQNYVTQFKDGSPKMQELNALVPLAEFMREREPYCFRGTPVHQAALLLSTYDRKHEATRLYSRTGYEKIMGMTALLCDIGQSLEIVCEHTLEKQRDAYKMIVVPELFFGLDKETIVSLLEYAENGGNLVLAGKNTCKIFAESCSTFKITDRKEFLDEDIAAGDNGHDGKASTKYRPYHFTLDENEHGALFSPCEISSVQGENIAYLKEDIREESAPLSARIPCGKGSITVIGFDIGSQYLKGTQYMHRKLMRTVCDSLYTPLVKLEKASGTLEIVPLMKDGKLMIQLINGGGSHANANFATDDYIPPVLDAELSLELDEKPQALILQPESKALEFEYRNGRAYFSVDRIDIHSIVEIITK